MKIAVPTRNNVVDGHFGHCEYYTIFTVSEDSKVLDSSYMASPEGCGCKTDIASVLYKMGVRIMLAGNMGEGAVQKINNAGIEIVRGCSGDVNDVVMDYLNNNITDSGISCSQHGNH